MGCGASKKKKTDEVSEPQPIDSQETPQHNDDTVTVTAQDDRSSTDHAVRQDDRSSQESSQPQPVEEKAPSDVNNNDAPVVASTSSNNNNNNNNDDGSQRNNSTNNNNNNNEEVVASNKNNNDAPSTLVQQPQPAPAVQEEKREPVVEPQTQSAAPTSEKEEELPQSDSAFAPNAASVSAAEARFFDGAYEADCERKAKERMDRERAWSQKRESLEADAERARIEAKRRAILDAAAEKDREDATDPRLKSVFVCVQTSQIVMKDATMAASLIPQDATDVLYRYHLPLAAPSVLELKIQLANDFGYAVNQQRIFCNGVMLLDEQDVVLSENSDCVHFIALGKPLNPPDFVPRNIHRSIIPLPSAEESLSSQVASLHLQPTASPLDVLIAIAKEAAVKICVEKVLEPVPFHARDAFGRGGDVYIYRNVLLRKAAQWRSGAGDGDMAFKLCSAELRACKWVQHKASSAVAPAHSFTVQDSCIVDTCGQRFFCMPLFDALRAKTIHGKLQNELDIVVDKTVGLSTAGEIGKFFSWSPECHVEQEPLGGRLFSLNIPSHTRVIAPRAADNNAPSIPVVLLDAAALWPTANGVKFAWLRPEFLASHRDNSQTIAGYEEVEIQGVRVWRLISENHLPLDKQQFFMDAPHPQALLAPSKNDKPSETLRSAADALDNVCVRGLIDDLNSLTVDPTTSADLVLLMHSRGINLRYLGIVANACSFKHHHQLCMQEIVARTVKTLIRDSLSLVSNPTAESLSTLFVRYLNEVFCGVPSESSITVWKYVEELAAKKFLHSRVDRVSVLDSLHLRAVVECVISKFGVSFVESAIEDKDFDFSSVEKPFSLADFNTSTLHAGLIANCKVGCVSSALPSEDARLLSLSRQAAFTDMELLVFANLLRAEETDAKGMRSQWHLPGGQERVQASEMFRTLMTKCRENPHLIGEDVQALVYRKAGAHFESRHTEAGRPENSRWNRCAFIRKDRLSEEAEYCYKKALSFSPSMDAFLIQHPSMNLDRSTTSSASSSRIGNNNTYSAPGTPHSTSPLAVRASVASIDDGHSSVLASHSSSLKINMSLLDKATCLAALARLSKERVPDPMTVRDLSDGDLYNAYLPFLYLSRAVHFTENALGFYHPRTASIYADLAMLCAEMNDPERASPWIRKAFVVTHGIYGKAANEADVKRQKRSSESQMSLHNGDDADLVSEPQSQGKKKLSQPRLSIAQKEALAAQQASMSMSLQVYTGEFPDEESESGFIHTMQAECERVRSLLQFIEMKLEDGLDRIADHATLVAAIEQLEFGGDEDDEDEDGMPDDRLSRLMMHKPPALSRISASSNYSPLPITYQSR
jgi:hypothetical protein